MFRSDGECQIARGRRRAAPGLIGGGPDAIVPGKGVRGRQAMDVTRQASFEDAFRTAEEAALAKCAGVP
jgi:hypothetical protein